MTWSTPVLRLLPFAVATVAVAGVVHIGTIFSYPDRARDDAFARIAALGSAGTKIGLPPPGGGRLPSRDPAMDSAICHYDLADGPFRIAVEVLEGSFVSVGMHGRHGVPFYGLNLRAGEGGPLDLILMTDQQKTDAAGIDDPSNRHQLVIAAPEAQGFVVMETPSNAPDGGRSVLERITCGPLNAPLPAPAG